MERQYNQLKKEEYASNLALKGNIDRAKEIILQDDYEPILKPVEIHPETEISKDDINQVFDDISADLDIVNSNLSITSAKFKNMLETTRLKLNNIKRILRTEKERQEDINILCNKYSDFSNVILISNENSSGDLSYDKSAFSIKTSNSKVVKGEIVEIIGNGYEGNNYVYKNNDFVSNVSNSSNKEYITDDSLITYYEYSRITASNSEKEVFPLVNFDSIMARCSILIKANDLINTIEMTMETDDVILESLSTSIDGKTFIQSELRDVAINSKKARFDTNDYIFGSGILSFQDCNYVKLVLRAGKNSNDSIAFMKKDSNNVETLTKLKTAKRSVIRINNIALGRKTYELSGQLVFNDFITDPVKSIAIFANEYVADEIDLRSSIKYNLTINGLDYEIIPINSQYNGKKIIRTTSHTIPAEHVHYINESIKSATLTINMKSSKQYTSPFISDLKVLIGGE